MNDIRIGPSFQPNLERTISSKLLELRQGQIIMGHVNKHFPNNMAEVQAGSQRLLAELSAPLSTDKNYWFQVQDNEDGKLSLKVLSAASPVNLDGGADSLLEQWSLPRTNDLKNLAAQLLNEKMPFNKDMLFLAGKWMESAQDSSKAIETIKEMLQRNLPFTEKVFTSLMATRDGNTMNNLAGKLLSEMSAQQLSLPKLEETLRLFETGKNVDLPDGGAIKEHLQRLLHTIGFSYENELLNNPDGGKGAQWNQLKPLLLDVLKQDAPASVKELANALTDKITGLQLLSQDSGPITQLMLQFPLHFQHHSMDATLQYSGKKTKDGKIDADFCRILFYLDLAYLKETAIDMHVQKRIVHLTVFNENREIEPLMKSMLAGLREKLNEVQYSLSSIDFKSFQEDKEKKIDLDSKRNNSAYYKGVDYRI
ncbi:hypothetical protein [Niallia sp. BSM11]|uniref:hypothetical protein n=1 Tax=Niallia sp. BSM11 TaxID=3391576 RepID=UPI003984FFE1